MTHEERQELIQRPFIIETIGGKAWGRKTTELSFQKLIFKRHNDPQADPYFVEGEDNEPVERTTAS